MSKKSLSKSNLIDSNLIDSNLIDSNLIESNLIDSNLIESKSYSPIFTSIISFERSFYQKLKDDIYDDYIQLRNERLFKHVDYDIISKFIENNIHLIDVYDKSFNQNYDNISKKFFEYITKL